MRVTEGGGNVESDIFVVNYISFEVKKRRKIKVKRAKTVRLKEMEMWNLMFSWLIISALRSNKRK